MAVFILLMALAVFIRRRYGSFSAFIHKQCGYDLAPAEDIELHQRPLLEQLDAPDPGVPVQGACEGTGGVVLDGLEGPEARHEHQRSLHGADSSRRPRTAATSHYTVRRP